MKKHILFAAFCIAIYGCTKEKEQNPTTDITYNYRLFEKRGDAIREYTTSISDSIENGSRDDLFIFFYTKHREAVGTSYKYATPNGVRSYILDGSTPTYVFVQARNSHSSKNNFWANSSDYYIPSYKGGSVVNDTIWVQTRAEWN